jgi:putative transposase
MGCWDDTPMVPFFASLKVELVHDESHQTRKEARASLFEYFEVSYEQVRRQSTLGNKSPIEYERAG